MSQAHVTESTLTMRQIAQLFSESTDPDVVRAAARLLSGGAMVLVASPTFREQLVNRERCAAAWNTKHGGES